MPKKTQWSSKERIVANIKKSESKFDTLYINLVIRKEITLLEICGMSESTDINIYPLDKVWD